MKNIFRYSAVIFAAALILSAGGGICYCDDSPQELSTFRGQVMEVDWVGSLITVQGGDEMTFYIPPGIKIRYGTGTASLEDIEQEDYVLIKYIDDPTGIPKAVSMSLNKEYPEFWIMTKTLKITAAVFFIAASLGVSSLHCADSPDQPKMIRYEGRISYIDWVGSKLILNGVGQKEFYVPPGTKMRKLGSSISFADLNILDNAVIYYYEDPSGKNVVVRITITVV